MRDADGGPVCAARPPPLTGRRMTPGNNRAPPLCVPKRPEDFHPPLQVKTPALVRTAPTNQAKLRDPCPERRSTLPRTNTNNPAPSAADPPVKECPGGNLLQYPGPPGPGQARAGNAGGNQNVMSQTPTDSQLRKQTLRKRAATVLSSATALVLLLTMAACSEEHEPAAIEPAPAPAGAVPAGQPTETTRPEESTAGTEDVNGDSSPASETTGTPEPADTTTAAAATKEPTKTGEATPAAEEATPAEPPGPVEEPLDGPLVENARKMVAERLGLTENQVREVTLEMAEAVTWPDSSLGCQQEGMAYAAAEVTGYRLTFAHGDRTMNAHGDAERDGVIIPQNCLNDPDSAGRPR